MNENKLWDLSKCPYDFEAIDRNEKEVIIKKGCSIGWSTTLEMEQFCYEQLGIPLDSSSVSKTKVKEWARLGWGSYRKNIMEYLDLTPFKDNVPQSYIQAFKWVYGRAEWPW